MTKDTGPHGQYSTILQFQDDSYTYRNIDLVFWQQEALLLQTDRATRDVSQNLSTM